MGRRISVLSGDDRECFLFYFNAFLLPFSVLTPYCRGFLSEDQPD